jgi:hypothetical protein
VALKVYRTPIGFHDAYVAASSQKAALTAWGSDANLFARGVAEQVTDPALTAEPVAHPGEVIKRLRGSAAEQLAAAPAIQKTRAKPRKSAPAATPSPRPDRAKLEDAEAALAAAEARHRDEDRALAKAEAALTEKRRALRASWSAEREILERTRDAAAERYAAALETWQATQA